MTLRPWMWQAPAGAAVTLILVWIWRHQPQELHNVVGAGFMLAAITAGLMFTIMWATDRQVTNHDERLENLEWVVAGWLGEDEQADADPATRPDLPVTQPDLPATVPHVAVDTNGHPAVTGAVADRRAAEWDAAKDELAAKPVPHPRPLMDPETAERRRAERAAWVESELEKIRARSEERNEQRPEAQVAG